MSKSYEDFLGAISKSESGGRYNIVNQYGFLGKYQFGEMALMDLGYYKFDGHKMDNKFKDANWTGKNGIKSKQNFLDSPQVQEKAIREFYEKYWNTLLIKNLDAFVGKTVFGVTITVSGLLAGAHLVGPNRLEGFIKRGKIAKDGNHVSVIKYIEKFSGYDTPFKSRKKLTGLKKDKNGKTVMYHIDGKEWVSAEMAIQMVKDKLLDGVIVTNLKGTVFLKTRRDQTTVNNLD